MDRLEPRGIDPILEAPLRRLCQALREHGILIAPHGQGCLRNKVYPTVVDRAAGCTCRLEEIQAEVRAVLGLQPPESGTP